ncbi:MAG TPA: hypothetical protein VNJ08_07230 [Bacteriovoracaceae bacterium]|nr:hypothetical protein [Bacteriovoracaceae bacterium]
MSYMSFFDGPGLFTDDQSTTPNAIGNPSDDGLVLMNNLSLKYKLAGELNLDFQTRFHYVMNNGNDVEDFKAFRWQSPRLGISTTFFKTQNSKLTGAFNTDLPYYFPGPIGGGYIAEKRTTIATPGLFAKYAYTPNTSRWSLFSLVQPRFYIYEKRDVAEDQLSRAGYSPRLKNEFTFSLSPSVNYAFTDKFGSRLGTEFIYKKLIASSWDPTNGTSKSADPDSKAWRLQPMPLQLGFTYAFDPMLEVSTYIQGFPIAGQRVDKKGDTTNFENTVAAGAWISGTLF